MRSLRALFCTTLLLLLPATDVAAQTKPLSYGFLWEQFAADTRSASMGRVDLADDGGPFSVWAIPAFRPRASGIQAGYRDHDYAVEAKIRGAAVALTTAAGRLRLAWNRAAYALDGIPVVAPDGTVIGGTSYDIQERVDVLGASYGFLSSRPGDESSIALVIGGAARLYNAEVSGLSGSASDFDLGATVRYIRDIEGGWLGARTALKVRNLLGRSYEIDEDTVQLPHHADLSLAFEGGYRLGWRNERDLQWLVVYTHRRHLRSHYGYPNDTNHVGAEITVIEVVSLRCGVTNIPIGGEKWSWGLGLSSRGMVESPLIVTIDYGQYDAGMLGGWSNLLTVAGSYAWGGR